MSIRRYHDNTRSTKLDAVCNVVHCSKHGFSNGLIDVVMVL